MHQSHMSQEQKEAAQSRQIKALRLLFLLLPSENYQLLQDLLILLNRVAAHKEQNLMSAINLGTMFAPHILCPRKVSDYLLCYYCHHSIYYLYTLLLKIQCHFVNNFSDGSQWLAISLRHPKHVCCLHDRKPTTALQGELRDYVNIIIASVLVQLYVFIEMSNRLLLYILLWNCNIYLFW